MDKCFCDGCNQEIEAGKRETTWFGGKVFLRDVCRDCYDKIQTDIASFEIEKRNAEHALCKKWGKV
jgi:hypothetical protein